MKNRNSIPLVAVAITLIVEMVYGLIQWQDSKQDELWLEVRLSGAVTFAAITCGAVWLIAWLVCWQVERVKSEK